MNLKDTIAGRCRWSEVAVALFGDWNVFFARGVDGYSGFCEIAAEKAGRFIFGGWSYGSCPGCDAWEDEPEEKVRGEMRRGFAEFASREAFAVFLDGRDRTAPSLREDTAAMRAFIETGAEACQTGRRTSNLAILTQSRNA